MIDEVLKKYPNDVKVVVKNFPLSFHKQAYKASKYALAANEQGKYKEMFHMIFCGTTESVPANECNAWRKLKENENLPIDYAQVLGLDINKFVQDFSSDKIKKQIDLEMDQFKNSGIPRLAVPKFLVQGKELTGKRTLAGFSAMIDAELAKIKK